MVPAELEFEDRLAGPVTFRMAGWLAGAAAGVGLLVLARDQLWTALPGVLLVIGGLAGAVWRPAGRPAPAWLGPLWAYRQRRRAAPTDETQAASAGRGMADRAGAAAFDPMPERPPTAPAPMDALSAEQWLPPRRPAFGRRGGLAVLSVTVLVVAAGVLLGVRAGWLTGMSAGQTPPPPTAAVPGGPAGDPTSDPPPAWPMPPSPVVPGPADPRWPGDGTAPRVLVPADPFWPWHELLGESGVWTRCGC